MYLIQFHIINFLCVHYKENQMYKAQYAFNMSMIMCPAVHMWRRAVCCGLHRPMSQVIPCLGLVIVYFYFKKIIISIITTCVCLYIMCF